MASRLPCFQSASLLSIASAHLVTERDAQSQTLGKTEIELAQKGVKHEQD
jgi:hypothetical protein